jgi:hypothetical protein
MPERFFLSGWQQFMLLLAGPLIVGGIFFFWSVARVSKGSSSKQRRKRKRKRF